MNPYIPALAKIEDIVEEVPGERSIKTFILRFLDTQKQKNFRFTPGQCIMVSLLGVGECMFAISSSPTEQGYLQVSVMKQGVVTKKLHDCIPGDIVGVRGPYGNGFTVDEWKKNNMVLIGGGIGLAPLRSLIKYILDNRKNYGSIDIIYGARSQRDLCFKKELMELRKRKDINISLSIDTKEKDWTEFVGFVPDNLLCVHPSPHKSIAVTCGPSIMIKFVIQNLLTLGFDEKDIFTTLEMRMKCGIGKCGRCNIGSLYVCTDGPVFSYHQLRCAMGER
jgi:NAD(P)H-flavin reductase